MRITDLIEEVDGWTGMSECFGHLRTGQPAPDRRALYAAIIADGLNLGLTRMAEACEGTTYWRLARLVDWHIREDAYAMATRMLVEAQARAPIAALWGDGSTSSSDGQLVPSAGRARGAGCLGVHYGTWPVWKQVPCLVGPSLSCDLSARDAGTAPAARRSSPCCWRRS